MSFLSFLNSAEVEEVAKSTTAKKGGPKKERNPAPALLAIRIWRDGSVYPSQALVDKFDLEFRSGVVSFEDIPARAQELEADGITVKVAAREASKKRIVTIQPPVGNGFDVIDTRTWGQWKDKANNMLFISPVDKDASKVDLFGSTVYDDAGKPRSTVMEQGAATFGKTVLLPTIKEVYGIELNDDKEYIDMLVAEELEGVNINTQFSKPINLFPKVISRGGDQGKADYVRRENAIVYGFVPASLVANGAEATAVEASSGQQATKAAE